jgi:hypothetical protein
MTVNARICARGNGAPAGGRRTSGALAELDRGTLRDPGRAAYWTCGIALFAAWNLAVVLGALAGAARGGGGRRDSGRPAGAVPGRGHRGRRHARGCCGRAACPDLPLTGPLRGRDPRQPGIW